MHINAKWMTYICISHTSTYKVFSLVVSRRKSTYAMRMYLKAEQMFQRLLIVFPDQEGANECLLRPWGKTCVFPYIEGTQYFFPDHEGIHQGIAMARPWGKAWMFSQTMREHINVFLDIEGTQIAFPDKREHIMSSQKVRITLTFWEDINVFPHGLRKHWCIPSWFGKTLMFCLIVWFPKRLMVWDNNIYFLRSGGSKWMSPQTMRENMRENSVKSAIFLYKFQCT